MSFDPVLVDVLQCVACVLQLVGAIQLQIEYLKVRLRGLGNQYETTSMKLPATSVIINLF